VDGVRSIFTAGRGTVTPGQVEASLRGRSIAVVGLAVTNLPLVEFLCSLGLSVTVFDQKGLEELGARRERLAGLPVTYHVGPGYLDALPGYETIFLTPGIRKDLPPVVEAARRGAKIGCEVGLTFAMCRAPILGITGSAGKTTTTTLAHLLLSTKYDARLGGNIGRPLVKEAASIPPGARVVCELSSFQLQLLGTSPEVSAILNISPNHLDVHSSMDEYVEAKKNVYRFQGPDGWVILNWGNPATRAMAIACAERGRGGVAVFGSSSGSAFVTATPPLPAGLTELAWTDGGAIFMATDVEGGRGIEGAARAQARKCGGGRRPAGAFICREDELRIPGRHNVENVLAALSLVAPAGLDPAAVRTVVAGFCGVEHRLEPVAEVNGVRYVNDSIATAPDRTIAALEAMRGRGGLVLILGGYDKKLSFDDLAGKLIDPHYGVRAIILVGATAGQIDTAVRDATARATTTAQTAAGRAMGLPASPPPMTRAADYEEVVTQARRVARPGDTVLLSPACASYDMFTNFEERGRLFKELVRRLPGGGS
jgi:UDP-N-acetylmuramoylalanine--D-glutamate ligase